MQIKFPFVDSLSAQSTTENSTIAHRTAEGWILACLSTLFFSFAPPIARSAIRSGIDSTTLVTVRLILASLLMGLTVALIDPTRLKMKRQGLLVSWLAGVVNGLGMLLFFWALERVDASMASMMISLVPLVVLSLLALRGERFTYRQIVRVVLGLTGVYLLIGPGGHVNLTGIGLLVIAVLCFATHTTLLQWYLRDYEALTITFHISCAMAISVGSWWLLRGPTWQAMSTESWIAVGALVVLSTYLSRICFVNAIARLGSGQVALFSPLETLLTVIWSQLFLGERLNTIQWMGGALVLSSALLAIQRLGRATWRPRWRLWSKV